MALVRKGSRRIVVDGTAYRWRLRGRPTYFQGLAWSPCTFAVEHADTPGMMLVATTDQPHPSNWIGHEAEPVLPSGVAAAVRGCTLAVRERQEDHELDGPCDAVAVVGDGDGAGLTAQEGMPCRDAALVEPAPCLIGCLGVECR